MPPTLKSTGVWETWGCCMQEKSCWNLLPFEHNAWTWQTGHGTVKRVARYRQNRLSVMSPDNGSTRCCKNFHDVWHNTRAGQTVADGWHSTLPLSNNNDIILSQIATVQHLCVFKTSAWTHTIDAFSYDTWVIVYTITANVTYEIRLQQNSSKMFAYNNIIDFLF